MPTEGPDYEYLPIRYVRAEGGDTNNLGLGTSPGKAVKSTEADTGHFEERADSPVIERGETNVFEHTYDVDWESGINYSQSLSRGTYMVDAEGGWAYVLFSRLQHDKPNRGILQVTTESGYQSDCPPEEYEVIPEEVNPPIWFHPFFKKVRLWNIDPDTGDVIDINKLSGYQLVSQAQVAANASQILSRDDNAVVTNDQLGTTPGGAGAATPEEVRLLYGKLVTKLRRGFHEFKMSGWRVIWSRYSWMAQPMDPGSYMQRPTDGGLPYYFWSVDRWNPESDPGTGVDNPGQNTLYLLPALVNRKLYNEADGGQPLKFMRLADHQQFNRTWFKLTSSWFGACMGTFDKDIYPYFPDSEGVEG